MDSPILWFVGLIVIGLILLVLSLPAGRSHSRQSSHSHGALMHNRDSYNLTLPDQWNEHQIETQLGRLIKRQDEQPNMLSYYLQTLRKRFLDRQDAKVQAERTKYLEAVIKNLATAKDAATLLYELRRLPIEQETKDIQARTARDAAVATSADDIEIAKMEREVQKKRLQAQAAKLDRKMQNHAGRQSREDKQMRDARDRHVRDIRFKVDLSAGTKVSRLAALQQWRKEMRRQILDDKTLTTDEREELLDELESSYSEEKRKLDHDTDIFEED